MQLTLSYYNSTMKYGYLKLCRGQLQLPRKDIVFLLPLWRAKRLVLNIGNGNTQLFSSPYHQVNGRFLYHWLQQMQELSGLGETNLAAFETLHFVNTLEQIVRGYLCGSDDSKWKSHLFANTCKSADNNVLNYFYRFEFQKQGTVHMHMLIWLKNPQCINLNPITADITWADVDSAYLVYSLQKLIKTLF